MSRATPRWFGTVVAVLLIFTLACSRSENAGSRLEQAPNFELKDIAGKIVRLRDFHGKVVLLDFWATYCIPCHESIPLFEKMYENYRTQGLEVIGLSIDAFTEAVPDFVKEFGISYTIVLDPSQQTPPAYGLRGLPTTFLIGRDGEILRRWTGYHPGIVAEIEGAVKETLTRERTS